MAEHILIGLASIIILGILAQWLAWRLHLPAILLLLVFGFIAGPLTGVLDPDEVFGNLLFPLVSVSVAIILFEGGLTLRFNELKDIGKVVRNLTTIGILVTWILATVAARLVIGLELPLAVLLGAILVVTGPTVIIPLLRQIRPTGSVGFAARWEGIINDPIGAILAVLVFEALLAGGGSGATGVVLLGVVKAAVFGTGVGLLGAGLMVLLLRRYLIPDFLQNPVALMTVVAVYVTASALQTEAGLLGTTVMGIALTNQHFVSIRHITEFKENLRVLLISSLFIILAARMNLAELSFVEPAGWIFVGLLIIIVRPIAVWLSTMHTGLKTSEKVLLAWLAPRGIVAAAVVSVFAIRLAEAGVVGGESLVPVTFEAVIGTVAIYGLTAPWVARSLKLASPDPQGILFAGGEPWVRDLAALLQKEKVDVAIVDSNWDHVSQARQAGLRAYYGSILSEDLMQDLQLHGIGRLLAMTPNDEVNSLAALHFVDVFGRSEVYQLVPSEVARENPRSEMPAHLSGRYLFGKQATFETLAYRFRSGAIVKKSRLTEEFGLEDFKAMYPTALPLVLLSESRRLTVCTVGEEFSAEPGQTIISIVDTAGK